MKKFFEEPAIELVRIMDIVSDDPEDELDPGMSGNQSGGVL